MNYPSYKTVEMMHEFRNLGGLAQSPSTNGLPPAATLGIWIDRRDIVNDLFRPFVGICYNGGKLKIGGRGIGGRGHELLNGIRSKRKSD